MKKATITIFTDRKRLRKRLKFKCELSLFLRIGYEKDVTSDREINLKKKNASYTTCVSRHWTFLRDMSFEERLKERQEHSKPLLDAFRVGFRLIRQWNIFILTYILSLSLIFLNSLIRSFIYFFHMFCHPSTLV